MNDATARDQLAGELLGVLAVASNFPERAQVRLLGQDMRPLAEKCATAILAAGFRRKVEEAMSTHHLQLFAEDGEIRPRLTCTATPDAVCRRRPVDTDQESWTDEDETTPGHECWAVEWAEDAGWDAVTAADGILSSVDVEVTYDEGVVVDLAPPQPTLSDLAEPSAAHDRALREQIAQKIEVEMRRHDNAQIGFSAVGDAYAHAARIAREEGQ